MTMERTEKLLELADTLKRLRMEREYLKKFDPQHGIHIQVGGRPTIQIPRYHPLHGEITMRLENIYDKAMDGIVKEIESL